MFLTAGAEQPPAALTNLRVLRVQAVLPVFCEPRMDVGVPVYPRASSDKGHARRFAECESRDHGHRVLIDDERRPTQSGGLEPQRHRHDGGVLRADRRFENDKVIVRDRAALKQVAG